MPVRATPANPIEVAAEVQHGARDYREVTLYLPTEVARKLSFYCMDQNCDVNRVVTDAVNRVVAPEAAEPAATNPRSSWGGTLEILIEQSRLKLSTLWALRRSGV